MYNAKCSRMICLCRSGMGTCSEVAAIPVPERLHEIYLLVGREIDEP